MVVGPSLGAENDNMRGVCLPDRTGVLELA